LTMAAPVLLNVDDDDAARYVKSRILKLAGFEVLEAADGAGALRMIREHSPELVLLDVRLPDINGRELCAQIKGEPATAQILVLQTSATHIDMKHRVASLDAGADGYLVAPMEPEELVAQVRALLRMRHAERERQKALDALREADRRKDEFLAMLAHELRNPLAPIRNAVEILRVSSDRDVRERARELIGRQVQHMVRLVDDLLEVSRLTQRKVVLQRRIVALGTILDTAVEVVRPALEVNDQTLVVSAPEQPVWLDVDAVRLSQVVGNLLNNAAKFTPRGGRIALEAALGADMLEILVSDNGVGIPAEMLPTVFELFSQADRSLERSQGGLGIGLSLVKGLVEMHGGTVAADSPGPGKGSVFTVRLPLAKLLAKAPGDALPKRAVSPAPRRILVVEDNVDSAEAMLLLLKGMGHDVTVVSDGNEAVEVARRLQPEVILLDIGLPGMDGYALARRLRGMPETRAAHLIAVSGYGQQKDRARSREAGFQMHLVKPVDPARLAEAIHSIA
jgi:signal transduction histidine kinase